MRTRILILAVVVLALAVAAPARGATFIALTSTNGVFQFDSASPGSPGPEYPITGLQTNEQIYGIDFRPATGQLYGIGSTSRLYTINPATGQATLVGPLSMPLSGGSFGVDFNPVSDRLRVISDADQNLEIDPATGGLTLGPAPMYPGGSPNPYISGVAYSNNTAGATSTTLYAIETNVLTMINQIDGAITPVGPLSGNPGPLTGFDIVDGGGYLAAGQFFDIVNLTNGSSAPAGQFPSPLFVKGLAAVPPAGGTPGGGTPDGGTPGGGLPGGGLPGAGDFDLDGDVDAADLLLLRRGFNASPNGVDFMVQGPEGLGATDELDFQQWRMNFGRSAGGSSARASQRRRAVVLVKARRRVTVGAGERKRVRLPLTKAGKRFLRSYKKKRLKVTLRFTARHRPATGTVEQRRFARRVTLRVKRTRR
jgi:hypothetical protein